MIVFALFVILGYLAILIMVAGAVWLAVDPPEAPREER